MRTPVYELTVYDTDDVTPLWTVSTDPEHEHPYLQVPSSWPEQEVDFAKSSASIGQMVASIIDVPTVPGDQDTGWMTAQLPDSDGYSALMGHRALFKVDFGSGAEVVLDGVCHHVRLRDSWAGYDLELRDIRERERKTKAFIRTDTPTILPRGVFEGYGRTVPTGPFFGGSVTVPVDATRDHPLRGVYRARTANWGIVEFSNPSDADRRVLTPAMRQALDSVAREGFGGSTLVFDRWKALWRPTGTFGAYTELPRCLYTAPIFPIGRNAWTAFGTGTIAEFRIDNFLSGGGLPANGQAIDFIVRYDGPVSEEWPYHIQGLTVGELLAELYDGDHSDEDPGIRYDSAAVLALTTPVRGRIKQTVEDLRAWTEKHAYPIACAAPTLNAVGEISPTTYLLPDENQVLPHLDDDNCEPAGGGWQQASEDAINVVRVTYQRDFVSGDPERDQDGDTVSSLEVTVEHQTPESVAQLHEERPLEIESVLLTALGGVDGTATGQEQDEVAHQVAGMVAHMAADRFALGGQYFVVRGMREDADVESLRPGSWVTCGMSWMPDYLSGERGLSRLAQVVSRRNESAVSTLLTLVDAGSANAPLFAPTLGTLSAEDDGRVNIPVAALGTGDPYARVDYALGEVEPVVDSDAWIFLGRVDAPGTLTTPPQDPGVTVWARARSELEGRRPSLYTEPVSIAVPEVPRLLELRVRINDDGTPIVDWVPGAFVQGVLLEYEHHAQGTVPTFGGGSLEVDAGDFAAELPVTVGRERVISVRATPYDGWTGSAVSGDPGPALEASAIRPRAISAKELVESARGWNTDIVFTPASPNGMAWTAGQLVLADGVVHEIDAGATAGEYDPATTAYVYWDPDVNPGAFQETEVFGEAVGERKLLIAILRTVSATGQGNATVIPIHGVAQWNGEHIVAASITADAIFGTTVSALFADLGIITAGRIDNAASDPTAGIRVSSAYSKPATWQRYLDLAATGDEPFLRHPLFELRANGDLRLVSSLDNLIRNPGFEASTTDFTPWREVVTGQGTWSITTTDPRSGLRCLRHDPAGMTDAARIENGSAGTRWEATEGDRFYFSVRYQTSGVAVANDVQIRIIFRDSAGNQVNAATATGTSGSTAYQLLEVTGTAGAGTTHVCFEIRVLNQGQTGIRTFDDCYARRMVDTTLLAGTVIATVLSGEVIELRDPNGTVVARMRIKEPVFNSAPLELYGGSLVPGVDSPSLSIDQAGGGGPAIGFLGALPTGRKTISGSRSDGSALFVLLSALEQYGLIIDDTTA